MFCTWMVISFTVVMLPDFRLLCGYRFQFHILVAQIYIVVSMAISTGLGVVFQITPSGSGCLGSGGVTLYIKSCSLILVCFYTIAVYPNFGDEIS